MSSQQSPTPPQKENNRGSSLAQPGDMPREVEAEPPMQSPIASIPATPVPRFSPAGSSNIVYIRPGLPAPNASPECLPESNAPAPENRLTGERKNAA